MMEDFFRQLASSCPDCAQKMRGYDAAEIEKIERLYGITVSGDLRDFLTVAGRCDGGLVGDDPIVLYRPSWTARSHLLFQMRVFHDLQGIGAWDYLNNPFFFSVESETQYFFLRTGQPNDEEVYWYDENNSTVRGTNKRLFDYLSDISKRYPRSSVLCCGDMLRI